MEKLCLSLTWCVLTFAIKLIACVKKVGHTVALNLQVYLQNLCLHHLNTQFYKTYLKFDLVVTDVADRVEPTVSINVALSGPMSMVQKTNLLSNC